MATITLRVDERVRDELDAVARARGVTVSDLVRGYIEAQHGGGDDRLAAAPPRTLALEQRHALVLMHRVLAKIGDDDYPPGHHERAIEALTSGYTAEYGEEFAGYSREMPRRDCELVWEILNMFSDVTTSLSRLPADERSQLTDTEVRRLEFQGFDANDTLESTMLSYARYLIDGGKWKELAPYFDGKHKDGNSHVQMLGRYQRQLDVYRPIASQLARTFDLRDLTLEELRAIAAA
ncbi:YfbU family protein [Cellulomonas sp.]|uniref:YfbU family protein n=1 Tax=Cellulomonas sp. TaxID=40001 RepID=UPI0028122F78|nr:YfbU family protein [Cellulomonas sp.]